VNFKTFFLLLLSSGALPSVLSQDAFIMGRVVDEKGEPLPFVNVISVEHRVGKATDLDGVYRFRIPAGKNTIRCSFTGYISDSVVVEAKAGQTIQKNFILFEATTTKSEVEIYAIRKTNTEIAVIQEVKESKQVVNAMSAEMIKKTGDSDAAEVVRRIPGVTIVGNNFIMIRGLSERYNNVLLHDVFAPSMETDVKSFSFDIIPSNMIDRVLIFKSPSPEITGEFSGGVVKIYTKSIPDDNFTSISYTQTYRSGTTFGNFKQPERGKWHWTGFNDGYYNLPSNIPASFNLNVVQNDPVRLSEYGKAFKNSWIPRESVALPDLNVSLTHGRKMKWGKVDVGVITALIYNNSRRQFLSERNDYNAYDFINNKSQFIYAFKDDVYRQNIRTSALNNWAFRFNSRNTIEFKNMFNVFSETEYINRRGFDYEFNYSPNNHSFQQVYRGIYSGQLMGKHQSKNELTTLNWTAGFGYSYRDLPDYRRYRSDIIDEEKGIAKLFVGVPVSPNYLGRFFSNMQENSQALSVLLTHKLKHENWSPLFKAGVFVERKNRGFRARNIGFVQSDFMQFDVSLLEGTIEQLFSPENINPTTGIRVAESTNPSDSYRASNFLTAGFVGAELPFFRRFNLNTGIRVEYNDQRLKSATISNQPVNVRNPILSILPSANLTYNLTKDEKMLLRLAYGKSVNRPEFRELAPFAFYDFNFNLVKKGSDSLRSPTIHNFDVRWELYPNPGEMITVAFFHKQFNDPIETLFVPGGGSGGIKTFTFGNAKMATSTGIELEVRKSLEGLWKGTFVDDLSLMFNGSLIRSHVELGMVQLGQSNERPLQGQSPYIVNMGLFYQHKSNGWAANMVYNIIGPRIFIIGFDVYPNIYEMPRSVLDFNITKKFNNNMEVKWNVGDVFNQEVLLLQDANLNKRFERNGDQIIQRFRPGSTMSLGFSYKF
jgi:outer membrane receptor for ferrienterochelin and colicin